MSGTTYEVAILTPYTSSQNPSGADASYTSGVGWGQIQGNFQQSGDYHEHQEEPAMSVWDMNANEIMIEDLVMPDAAHSVDNLSALHPRRIEIAQSVSGYSSVESFASCTKKRETWMSQSSWSFDGFSSEAGHSHSSSQQDDDVFSSRQTVSRFPEVSFVPLSSALDEALQLVTGQANSNVQKSSTDVEIQQTRADSGLNEDHDNSHLEKMLVRVAEDICSLGKRSFKNQKLISESSIIQSASTNRTYTHQPLHINSDVDAVQGASRSSCRYADTSEFFSATSDCSGSELYMTAMSEICEDEESVSSASSSCMASRSSSQSELFSSHPSEETSVDVESLESPVPHEGKFKHNVKTLTYASVVAGPPRNSLIPNTTKVGKAKRVVPMDVSDSNSGNETETSERSSNGSNVSATKPAVASNYEFSVLNPLSKPFVPRAYLNSSVQYAQQAALDNSGASSGCPSFSNAHVDLEDSNMNHTKDNEILLRDSGLANNTDLTRTWNTTVNTTDGQAPMETFNDSAFPRVTPAKSRILQNLALAKNYDNMNISKLISHKDTIKDQPPPYNCKISHKKDFLPNQSLTVNKLPNGFQSIFTLETILSISQRVVRLRVRKPFSLTSSPTQSNKRSKTFNDSLPNGFLSTDHNESEDPFFDHYGTGFAYKVDKRHMEIRTHAEVVGSAKEAEDTEVSFVITFPGGSQGPTICCTGQAEDFRSDAHSQATVFKCKTPPELVPYLYLFKDIPVARRSSLFSDSCYFTDSSPDTSATERDDLEQKMKQDIVQPDASNQELDIDIQPCLSQQRLDDAASVSSEGENETSITAKNDFHSDKVTDVFKLSEDPTILSTRDGVSIANTYDKEFLEQNDKFFEEKGDFWEFLDIPLISPLMTTDDDDCFICVCDESTSCHSANTCLGVLTPKPENPFAYCGLDESLVRQAFESVDDSFSYLFSEHTTGDTEVTPHAERPEMPRLHDFLRDVAQGRTASPLAIMERRCEDKRNISETGSCPYAGQNLFGENGVYSHFSSFAGDIFSSLNPLSHPNPTDSNYSGQDHPRMWEYESLVYAQNLDRQAYNRLYKPVPHWDIPSAVSQEKSILGHEAFPPVTKSSSTPAILLKCSSRSKLCKSSAVDQKGTLDQVTQEQSHDFNDLSDTKICAHSEQSNCKGSARIGSDVPCSTSSFLKGDNRLKIQLEEGSKRDLFDEFLSTDTYLDTWDRDLLNLDDHLNPLPEYGYFESLVDQLVSEEVDKAVEKQRTSRCCPFTAGLEHGTSVIPDVAKVPVGHRSHHALIISHPHGGPKLVSFGHFSRHFHVGGTLYDTPTCMGSCGAPVIALSENGGGPYVTHFVHAGTIKVNGICTGAGISFFDQPEQTFQV